MFRFQFQFFGRGNTQLIGPEIRQSLSSILVSQADALKTRIFESEEVRNYFFDRIDEITQSLNGNPQETLDASKYILFPFKAIAIQENLQKEGYIRSMLDTLSVLAFTDFEFDIINSHINIKIENKNIFGIYYTDGNLNLRDCYVRLLKNMTDNRVTLPSRFICIPLDTSGAYTLETDKIENIVTSIVGDSSYIKPLRMGTPRCISLSSYIVTEANSVEEAQSHVRGVLGLG